MKRPQISLVLLLLAIVSTTSMTCKHRINATLNTSDSLQLTYNLVSLTSENELIYPIPFSMGSNVVIGRGVNLADPDDPYVTKASFFDIHDTFATVTPTSKWPNVKTINIKKPDTINFKNFRSASQSSFIEDASDEQMAVHIYANFKGRFGIGKMSAAMDYVKNARQSGHLILFNREVDVATSDPSNFEISQSALKELKKIDDYADDEKRFSHFLGKFGSHYISDITYGSRIFMSAYVKSTDDRVKASVSIAFKNFSIDARAGGEYESILRNNSVELKMRIYGGKGTADQIFDNIDQIKDFFIKYNKGEYKITLAPISCRVISYRSELEPTKFPNLERIFKRYKGTRSNAPYGVPKGTIIAWFPPRPATDTSQKLAKLIPDGWAICDGNGTPDLTDRFIYGAKEIKEVGATGGSVNHSHATTMGKPEPGDAHHWLAGDRLLTIEKGGNLPPYLKLIYLIKK